MKANELMIGDWVYRPNCYDRVKETRQNGIIGLDSLHGLIGFSEIEPIPLTPEILEKNGFIGDKNVCKIKMRDDSKDELWQCEYAWFLKNLRIKNHTNGSIARLYDIMFVHELQHTLRLCGIKKEIIL